MAEQEVTGISGQLALDITQWSEAIDAAKSELRGLTQAAGSVAVNVRAPKAAAATGRQGMAVTPAFSVTQHAVRDLRADINQTLRAHAGQGQAVGVPIKLGRVAWGAIRTQIAAEIGVIPIKVSVAGVAGTSSKNVLAAMMSVSTGSTMGKAQTDIESAAASRGIPKRASGGPAQAHRPIVVGDAGRPEVYVPDSHGRVVPSIAEWWRLENERRTRSLLSSRNSPTHAEIDSELHDRYRFAFRASGGPSQKGGTPRYAANIRRAARSLTPQQIEFGRQWFPAQSEWLRGLSRQYGLPEQTVMGMAAAQSGATSWGGSKTKLLRILEAHRTGAAFPYPGGLSADRLAERILRGETPAAVIGHMPKIGAFYQTLSGNLNAYTLDRWGLRTATRGQLTKIKSGP